MPPCGSALSTLAADWVSNHQQPVPPAVDNAFFHAALVMFSVPLALFGCWLTGVLSGADVD